MNRLRPKRPGSGYSPHAFAQRIRKSDRIVNKMIANGEVRVVKLGGMKIIPDDELPRVCGLLGIIPPPEPEPLGHVNQQIEGEAAPLACRPRGRPRKVVTETAPSQNG
ncbi:hypothetical protein [Bosea sp. NBC_00550]|uniref:hypothetical protein n=1 Tax=Bosea sp. NBC_00550 TaxID=2969621 RepID=UPI002231C937|nr:hypothetical protein [Bosea sp. NBC_00550]UZF94381.1 hypothetical protein NWE53_09460 [Bosea sp. NBC_00550]